MSQPFLVTERYSFSYTVAGLPHQVRQYLTTVPGGGASGRNLVMRDTTTGVDARAAATNWWTIFAAAFQVTVTVIGSASLEKLVGTTWQVVDSFIPTVTLTGSSAYTPAGQMSAFFRDDLYNPLKVILGETIVAVGLKFTALGSGAIGTPLQKYITAPAAGTPDPWNWVLSRSGRPVKSFTSFTTDLNDKIRRARFIA